MTYRLQRRDRWDLVFLFVVGVLVMQVLCGNATRDCKFSGARLATADLQEQCPECDHWSGAKKQRTLAADWFVTIVEAWED